MTKIQTLEVDVWSEPDENCRVRHVGMVKAQETFEKLKTHLEKHGLLPEDYFLFSSENYGLNGELPKFEEAICIPSFGSSEGIYLDISLICRDKAGKRFFQQFAVGKTLGETADDYLQMFRIAAECSLLLNGRGYSYERNNIELVLTEIEASAVAGILKEALHNHLEPEKQALLFSVALQLESRLAVEIAETEAQCIEEELDFH